MNLYDGLFPLEVTRPAKPEPKPFRFDGEIGWFELSRCSNLQDRERLYHRLKAQAAQALAQHIAETSSWMAHEDPLTRSVRLRIHLDIDDRGSYENWLPRERAAGVREGDAQAVRRLTDSLPHGLADAATEFYE